MNSVVCLDAVIFLSTDIDRKDNTVNYNLRIFFKKKLKLKPDKFFVGSHGCHTILLVARLKDAHPVLIQASKAGSGTRFTYTGGIEG